MRCAALCQERLLGVSLRRGLLSCCSPCHTSNIQNSRLAPKRRRSAISQTRAASTEGGQGITPLGALSVNGLQHPSPLWTTLAWGVYSVFIPLAVKDQLVPQPVRELAYKIAGSHQNVYYIFLGAVAIHAVEAAAAFYVARTKKGFGVGHSLWWMLLGFIYGYIGLSLLFGQAPESTKSS